MSETDHDKLSRSLKECVGISDPMLNIYSRDGFIRFFEAIHDEAAPIDEARYCYFVELFGGGPRGSSNTGLIVFTGLMTSLRGRATVLKRAAHAFGLEPWANMKPENL